MQVNPTYVFPSCLNALKNAKKALDNPPMPKTEASLNHDPTNSASFNIQLKPKFVIHNKNRQNILPERTQQPEQDNITWSKEQIKSPEVFQKKADEYWEATWEVCEWGAWGGVIWWKLGKLVLFIEEGR